MKPGARHSPAAREKMRQAKIRYHPLRGKKRTAEEKAKMSATAKLNWASPAFRRMMLAALNREP